MGPGVRLSILQKKSGEWFDMESHSEIRGNIVAVNVSDSCSGDWTLNLKISEDLRKCEVAAVTSSGTTILHDQVKHKTMVLKAKDENEFYSLLGLAYIQEDRLRMKRVSSRTKVPVEISNRFELVTMSSLGKFGPMRDKIAAIVNKEDYERIALLFYLQKIAPILDKFKI
ncbi:MAG: hypothetical protein QXS93_00605 [Candidatus Micrarchaeia archaeon]